MREKIHESEEKTIEEANGKASLKSDLGVGNMSRRKTKNKPQWNIT